MVTAGLVRVRVRVRVKVVLTSVDDSKRRRSWRAMAQHHAMR